MDKTERLLDLIALLLDARDPLTWSQIREAFPDEYGKGGEEAAERKFERDKAALADLGIVIRHLPPNAEGREGYVLSREDYYLPAVDFTPEEMAVLYAAGSAALVSGAFPGRADLAHALRKIAFVSREDPESAPPRLFADHGHAGAGLAGRLEMLWEALVARKRVRLSYRSAGSAEPTERDVDPWGLCLRRGVWVLVGYCHLRKARRTFHVDRIEEVRAHRSRPRSPDYEVPADFDIAEVAREQVWEHRFHPPLEVELALDAQLAPMAQRLFPNAQVEPAPGGGAAVRVSATYLDGLLRRVLPLSPAARVVAPAAALDRARQMLAKVHEAHAEKSP